MPSVSLFDVYKGELKKACSLHAPSVVVVTQRTCTNDARALHRTLARHRAGYDWQIESANAIKILKVHQPSQRRLTLIYVRILNPTSEQEFRTRTRTYVRVRAIWRELAELLLLLLLLESHSARCGV